MGTNNFGAVLSNRFCTDAFSPNERFEVWREKIHSSFGQADVSRAVRSSFSSALTATTIGPISPSLLETSSVTFERTAKHIAQSEHEHVLAALVKEGTAMLEHCGRRTYLGPGDLVIGDFRRPLRLVCHGPFEEALLRIDLELFSSRFACVSERTGIAFRQSSPLFTNLVHYLAGTADANAAMQETLARHALEVLAIALDEPPSKAPPQGLLLRIQNYIEDHLADSQLSPDILAQHHRISRRHLYRIFGEIEGSISGYIRQRRLLRSKCLLISGGAKRSIAEIAFEVGFADVTTFGRAFRRAFGMSPRELRSVMHGANGTTDE